MINTVLELGSQLLKELFADHKNNKKAQEVISELLLEEVRWNLELVQMTNDIEDNEKVLELMNVI